jgi:glutamine amidotransferase
MVGVVDYQAGNLKSVETALRFLDAHFFVTRHPEEIEKADRLIFPGVGEARAAMTVLDESGLGSAIVEFFRSGKPLLGICLGCQIVMERSEERDAGCLGLIQGTVERFPPSLGLKVPHMGWNQVHPSQNHPLFKGIRAGSSYYFVHSYYPAPSDEALVLAETEYGITFASALEKGNLRAVQFHPEKSGKVGLKLLANFLDLRD